MVSSRDESSASVWQLSRVLARLRVKRVQMSERWKGDYGCVCFSHPTVAGHCRPKCIDCQQGLRLLQKPTAPGEKAQNKATRAVTARGWRPTIPLVIPGRLWAKCRQCYRVGVLVCACVCVNGEGFCVTGAAASPRISAAVLASRFSLRAWPDATTDT